MTKLGAGLSNQDFLQRCRADLRFFMEECCFIEDKITKRLIAFSPNNEQLDVLDVIQAEWDAQKPVRVIIVKPRQVGFTTLSLGIGYWMESNQPQTRGLCVAQDEKTAADVFQMVDRFATNDTRAKRGCMPMIRSLSRKGIRFGNPDYRRRARVPGLDSSLSIATADNRNAGHGWSGRFLHGTEVARWKYPEVMAGLLNALTDAPYTLGILESTASGSAGIFYETWTDAVDGQNEWLPLFVSWKERAEYTAKMTAEQVAQWEPTPVERELMERHKLSVEQMEWRRRTINSPRCKDPDRAPEAVFQEQFPLEWEEAFQGKSKSFFDMAIVAQREAIAKEFEKEKPPSLGVVITKGRVGRGKPQEVAYKLAERGWLTVWEPPIPGQDYVIGCDIGVGLTLGDYSNGYVMHRHSQRFVARLRTKEVYPEVLGDELLPALGWWYNQAFLAPEGNNVGIVTARNCALVYPRVMFKVQIDKFGNCEPDTEHPGFWQDRSSRRDILLHLRNNLRAGQVFIPCPIFWSEAKTFVIPEGVDGKLLEDQPRAARKKKDDCIISAAITLRVNDPYLGAGPIRHEVKEEAPDMPFRVQLISEHTKALQKQAWRKTSSAVERDDDLGDW